MTTPPPSPPQNRTQFSEVDRPRKTEIGGLPYALRQTADTGKAILVPSDREQYVRSLYTPLRRRRLRLHIQHRDGMVLAWCDHIAAQETPEAAP